METAWDHIYSYYDSGVINWNQIWSESHTHCGKISINE